MREARYPLYTFVSTNDFHGQLEPKAISSSNPALWSGSAYDMVYINETKALNPLGTTLLYAGDIMQGSPISNLLFGESGIDVYNHMGYKAAVTGNHEFDWGISKLQERMAQAEFPILVANIFIEDTDIRPPWAKPTTMFTVKGQQIGVIGVTSIDTPTIVMAGNLAGYEFHPVGPIVSELAAELRAAGADLVVAGGCLVGGAQTHPRLVIVSGYAFPFRRLGGGGCDPALGWQRLVAGGESNE